VPATLIEFWVTVLGNYKDCAVSTDGVRNVFTLSSLCQLWCLMRSADATESGI
jgi:hypothetical protein